MRVDKDFSKNEPFDDIDRLFEHSDSKIPAPGNAFSLTLADLRAQHELEPAVAFTPEQQPVPLRPTLITLRGVVAAFASAGLVAMLSIALLLAANFSSGVSQDAPPTIESFAAPTSSSLIANTAAPAPVKVPIDGLRSLPQYLDYTELTRRQSTDEPVVKRPVVTGNNSISSGFLPQIDRTGDNTVRLDYQGRSFK
jgi:uncharacterized protein (DUF58 family)